MTIEDYLTRCTTYKTRAEWLAARYNYIGGSEASAIIGLNPYMTNVELWELKTGRRDPKNLDDNELVVYGAEAEKHLRALYRLDHPEQEVYYAEYNMWHNKDFPFAHASLDGWIKEGERNGVLEIKTATIQSSAQRAKWDDKIPDNYFVQVLHYLLVTGFDFAVLKAQIKYDHGEDIMAVTKHYRIERADVQADIDYLAKEEALFYQYIQDERRPPLVLPTI